MEQAASKGAPGRNQLGTEPVGSLILKFALPAIASNLVTAAYNIVDQIFIGQGVGMLGNAATNVAFPLTNLCAALSLMIGAGTSSNFNLNLGAGNRDKAAQYVGNGLCCIVLAGLCISVLASIFLQPLMLAFGATDQVLPYAMTYTRITALGIPFVVFTVFCGHMIRADGSPAYALFVTASGAILNTILDPLFIFVFGWGIAGAAAATVIGQVVSATLGVLYFMRRFRSVPITRSLLRIRPPLAKRMAMLGLPPFTNHFITMWVQIAMNNTLRHYGGLSGYGSDIPLACAGVINKVNVILIAFTVGIAQASQPIFSFNYGAKQYGRVKQTYKRAAVAVVCIALAFYICFQLFPRQIVSIFGSGSEMYFQFAERYFRIYMALVFTIGIQQLTGQFFSSIGNAKYGMLVSLTRQGLFQLPLILILPLFWGIDGVMYAGPIADGAAVIMAVILLIRGMRKITAMEQEQAALEALGTLNFPPARPKE